jgi:hypothetical protein
MTTHITKAGRAVGEVRERHDIFGTEREAQVYEINSPLGNRVIPFEGTWTACEKWIDEQMATAVIESVLPVADDVVEAAAALLYTPPISPPEFLAKHGERLEKRHREAASMQATKAITAAMTAILGRDET